MSTVEFSSRDVTAEPTSDSTQHIARIAPHVRRRTAIGEEPVPDWRDSAACVGRDLNLFFPISSFGQASVEQISAAKAVCSGCPVRRDCLDWALDVGPEFGIFGGHTEAERRVLRQQGVSGVRRVPCPSSGMTEAESLELN